MQEILADILLPLALPATLTYLVPHEMADKVFKGQRVVVGVGKSKQYIGIIVALHNDTPPLASHKIKSIVRLVDEEPLVTTQQLGFWQWIADYYMCTLGEVMKAALPAPLKSIKPTKETPPPPEERGFHPTLTPLSPEQQRAFQEIKQALYSPAHKAPDVCLLHGVTSSGKTEVYVHLIAEALARGEQVLYLLPEIALTTQITERLSAIFGNKMGVYHSRFTDQRRARLYRTMASATPCPLVLGVRSALFLPYKHLGLIIVDEEHETSYKQQDPAPRYHARDAAIVLAKRTGAKVLLGTATPSLETYHNAQSGKYALVEMHQRYGGVALPEIVVADIKELRRKKLMTSSLSPRLIDEMREALKRGEQTILFQNRRGYAPQLSCRSCGWTPQCTSCDVSLTYHARAERLVCHYCGQSFPVPKQCPQCGDTELRDIGYGTEKIEQEVASIFPTAHICRMDLDTTRSNTAYTKIINDFQHGNTDILIGTQMVTKGLDFQAVSVVGILNADQSLNQPNFRAAERTYQMMAQVAGRAGRRTRRGIVVLQTYRPLLPLFQQVTSGNYNAFFGSQLAERREFVYPPFVRVIDIHIKHRDDRLAEQAATTLSRLLRPHFANNLLGPYKPVVARIGRLCIRKMMLKVPPTSSISATRRILLAARATLLEQTTFRNTQVFFDVDPL